MRITIERLGYLKDLFDADEWSVDETTGVMTILTHLAKRSVLMWAEQIRTSYDYRYIGMSENPNGIIIRFGL